MLINGELETAYNELAQAQVNLAIDAIENGAQEYRIGTRSLKRGDLKTLYDERRKLKAEAAIENGDNIVVAQFDGR